MNHRKSKATNTSLLIFSLFFSSTVFGAEKESSLDEIRYLGERNVYSESDVNKRQTFLSHQCFEGRQIVSLQDIPRSKRNREGQRPAEIYQLATLKDKLGHTLSCSEEPWHVFSIMNLRKQVPEMRNRFNNAARGIKEVFKFCVSNNLVIVYGGGHVFGNIEVLPPTEHSPDC